MVDMKSISGVVLTVALFVVIAASASGKDDDSVMPATTAAPAEEESVKANQSLPEENSTARKSFSPHDLFKKHKHQYPFFRVRPRRHRKAYKSRRPHKKHHRMVYRTKGPFSHYMTYVPSVASTPNFFYSPYKTSKSHNYYYKNHKPKDNYTTKLLKFLSNAI